jgi:DNA-directed RNA polymerase specialized sigma24 family protein
LPAFFCGFFVRSMKVEHKVKTDAMMPTVLEERPLRADVTQDDYVRDRIEFLVNSMIGRVWVASDAAEDLRQRLYLVAHRATRHFSGGGKATWCTYVCRVLEREAWRFLKQLAYRRRCESAGAIPSVIDEDRDGVDLNECSRAYVEEHALAMDVAEIMAGLPEDLQKVCREFMGRGKWSTTATTRTGRLKQIARLQERLTPYFSGMSGDSS